MEMTVTFDSNITEAHSSFTCRPSEAEIKEQKNQKQKQTTQRVVAFEREVQKIIILLQNLFNQPEKEWTAFSS